MAKLDFTYFSLIEFEKEVDVNEEILRKVEFIRSEYENTEIDVKNIDWDDVDFFEAGKEGSMTDWKCPNLKHLQKCADYLL